MEKKQTITQEEFDNLMSWLDPDREKAGEKYETIRRGLINTFSYRGCSEPEDMADETINRVARKTGAVAKTFSGDPVKFFHGVAKKVHLEYLRHKTLPLPETLFLEEAEDIEPQYDCLNKCIDKLSPENREIILIYYQGEKKSKIASRKDLCKRLGITQNTLRVRAHRIREGLEKCVSQCLKEIG